MIKSAIVLSCRQYASCFRSSNILTMIRASKHQDTSIIFQSIYLVQEVTPRLWRDEAVNVFEDE